MWQWIAVAIVVVLAAIALVRSLRRDPCAGCSLKQQCKRNLRSVRIRDTAETVVTTGAVLNAASVWLRCGKLR